MVRNSWKPVPNRPRIEVSANSEMNIGVTTHEPPVEMPAHNESRSLVIKRHDCLHLECDYAPMAKRAKYSWNAPVADTVRNQLRMNGIPIRMAVYLRPIRSASKPAGRAPANAPIAKKDAIHVSVI